MTSRKRRALAPCEECGKVSRRVVGRPLCAECLGYESNKLEGGRWVIDLRRRVLVWQADATALESEVPRCVSHNTERGYQWHRYWRVDWPLPFDDPCGCRRAHAAHEALMKATGRRARSAVAS